MELGNFTKRGLVALGEVVEAALEAQGWDQKTLVDQLAARGHLTNKDKVSRLVTAAGLSVDAALVIGVARLRICLNPTTKEPYSSEDLFDLACELIDPQTGLRKSSLNGATRH